jgi:formyltetrahydrofolate deformylase
MDFTNILRVDCRDEPGLIYKITGVLYHHGLNIVRNDEFVDRPHQHFFFRAEVAPQRAEPPQADKLVAGLWGLLPQGANIQFTDRQPKRLVILATKEHHCLSDLLLRHEFGELNAQVLAVASNHATLGPLVAKFGLPFHHLPHEGLERAAHEAQLLACLEPYQPDYVVLAKYMRVLSPELMAHYPHRMVNIHHSFLPAFVGANPYRQAFERGVKIIGATAHFVNEHLDEGPIIGQDVVRVDHSKTATEMAQAGRDVEKIVLAKALKLVCEDRIFVIGNKTVIFE